MKGVLPMSDDCPIVGTGISGLDRVAALPASDFELSDLPEVICWKNKRYVYRPPNYYNPDYNHGIPDPHIYTVYMKAKWVLQAGRYTDSSHSRFWISGCRSRVNRFEYRYHEFLIALKEFYTSNYSELDRDRSKNKAGSRRMEVTVDFPLMQFE